MARSRTRRAPAPAEAASFPSAAARFAPAVLAPALLAAAALAPSPAPLAGQDASDFLEEARSAYEARMEGIQSYELTAGIGGMETTTRHVRREVDGVVLFLPEDTGGDEMTDLDPAFFYRPDVARRMRLEGEETVEGTSCRTVVLDDFEGLDMARAMGGGDGAMGGGGEEAVGGFEPRSMRMCLDPGDYLVRQVVMDGLMTAMGEPSEMSVTMVFTDYREVDGMVHPFRVEITTSGLAGAMGGEQAEAMAAMEQLREQLESLPEAQREAMEEMMQERMGGMEALMGAAAGSMVVETTALEVSRGGG